jgi:long-chain fatty acid transport protein
VAALCVSLALSSSSTAAAQDLNYQRIPIGNRAVGMGGAYTGIAEDLSAVWYNPGGLALLEGATISGGLSINVFDDYQVTDGYGFGGQTVDINDDGSISIPFFVGGMAKIGEADGDDQRRHALAASAVNPSTPSRRADASIAVPSDGTAAALRIQTRDRVQQYGPSYAYRVNDDLGIGLSAFLSIHDLDYEESEIVTRAGPRQPDGTFIDSSVAARISGGEASVFSLLFRVGALWRPTDRLRLGLMLQVPNLPIYRSGRIEEFVSSVGSTGVGTFDDRQEDTTPQLSQPFEARLGVGYQPLDNWRLALDLSIYAPMGSEDQPRYVFGEPTPDPATGVEPAPGRFYSNAYWTQTSFNVAVGMETVIADIVPLSFGAYTDLSPVASIDAPSDTYRAPHMDNLGLTAVIGYRKGGYNFAVGGALVLGWGTALANDPNAMGTAAYVPRDARQTSLYIFVTGYAEAAEQLATDVESFSMSAEERERRERQEAEARRLEELRRACEERLARELADNREEDGDEDTAREAPPREEEPQNPE